MRYFWIFLLISINIVIADSVINEIHYNPSGSDNNKEFVEILSDSYVNLTGYTIEDSGNSDVLTLLKHVNSDYALIVESGFDFSSINCSVYSAGATIGNNLNNDEDVVILRDISNDIVDVVYYFDDWGGDDNDKSLERIDKDGFSSDSSNWKEGGSAGEANSVAAGGCDWTLDIILNGTVFDDPEFKVKATKLNGDRANLSVAKWIVDSEGNTDKQYSAWNFEAVNYKTSSKYSPAISRGDAYYIRANITNSSCVDSNLTNNYVSELIYVTKDAVKGQGSESYIEIDDIPAQVEFGDIVNAEITVYLGDTAKYAVYASVEDEDNRVSEKSTMHFKDKFTKYVLNVPIQMKTNCNERYDEGVYNVVIEGLDLKEEKAIEIEGYSSFCDKPKTAPIKSTKNSKKFVYELVSKPNEVIVGEKFPIDVKLQNNDDEDIYIEIWSYVYRGNKAYTGDREDNKENFVLDAEESKTIRLYNDLDDDVSAGDYKLKIKIRKNHQKTTNDITGEIVIVKPTESEVVIVSQQGEVVQEDIIREGSPYNRFNPITIYESSSSKAKENVSYFILSGFGILGLILVLRY